MSKIFEALQRLERESGRSLPGVSEKARQVLGDAPTPASGAPSNLERGEDPVRAEAPEPQVEPIPVASDQATSELARLPVNNVTIRPSSRIVYHTDPDSAGADRFRLLRMHLWPLWGAGKLKTVFVTSACAQDGKSTVVLNLATALAEKGKRNVLVVEGDLVHPSIAERLGLAQSEGLAETLEAARNPISLVRRIEPLGWYLLSAGRAQTNPTELLQSPILEDIFGTLRSRFEWVIIDTPPVMPLTDTLSLRQHADAGLLVVRADRTPRNLVEAAIGRIGSEHLLGLILNASEEFERMYSEYQKTYGKD